MRRTSCVRSAAILLAGGCFVGLFMARAGYAAAPNVRIVTPAGITIDGSASDWDSKSADYLADMFQAGIPSKPVLSKVYGRYDCGTLTFYMYVETDPQWVILPSDNDNYVKIGSSQKLVDGGDSGRTQPPAFAYIGTRAWEVAFKLPPGSYTGDGGLNVHAEVTPIERADTSAVAGRRMDVVFSCPNPTPTPTAPPTAAPTPTAPPSSPPSVPPSAAPESPSAPASESPSLPSELPSTSELPSVEPESPSAPASESPSLPSELPSTSELPSVEPESPSAPASEEPSLASEEPSLASEEPSLASESPSLASELPSTSELPSVEPESPSEPASEEPSGAEPSASVAPEPGPPPLIVAKVNNKGTTALDDDRLVGGATFEIRVDDGDGVYEPDADDGAPTAELDATKGYATYQPPESGDYWVKEIAPPAGLATAKAMLVTYDATDARNCAVVNGNKKCKADEDGSGGYVVAVISDAPVGHPLPQTDTVAVPQQAPSDDALFQVFLALVGVVAIAVVLVRPSRRAAY